MKKYIKYIGLVLIGVAAFSCNKDSFNYKPGYVGISKITHYADFSLVGSPDTSILVGATYTDPGASASQSGTKLTVTTVSTVNASKVGIYTVTYSATNSDGFPASTARTIAVLPSAEQAGVDISGTYNYAAGGTPSTITKLAAGFYYSSNVWNGAANQAVIPAYLICVNGTNIILPTQQTGYGELDGTGILSGNTSGSTLNYTINLGDQGVSNSVRKWIKK